MTSKLSKYVKINKEETSKTTSINLEIVHMEFLKRNKLNLSSIVRDLLTKLIEEERETLKLL